MMNLVKYKCLKALYCGSVLNFIPCKPFAWHLNINDEFDAV